MFDCFELQMLISGGKDDINIDDWKNNVLNMVVIWTMILLLLCFGKLLKK